MIGISSPLSLLEPVALGPELACVHQVLLIIVGFGLACAARLESLSRPAENPRRLFFYGLIQTASASLRLVPLAARFEVHPWILAVHSFVEIAVLAGVVLELRSGSHGRALPRQAVPTLGALAFVALLCGFAGGAEAATLIGRNLPAAICQVAVVGGAALLLTRAAVDKLDSGRRELVNRLEQEVAEQHCLQQTLGQSRQRCAELDTSLARQRESVVDLRRRTRTLEQILTVSARNNATRGLTELYERVVAAAEEVLGLTRVALYVFSDSIQAYQARAFTGFNAAEQAHIADHQISSDDYRRFTDSRHRYSNCFLVRETTDPALRAKEDADEAAATSRGGVAWSEGDVLIAPLVTAAGDTRGFLSIGGSMDGQIPSPVDIRQLEFLVQQTTTALESVKVYDRLAHRNAELAQASEKLNSLADMKANFVANVSHELRTPLTSISAYTELLQRGTDAMSDDMRHEFLLVINQESAKLTRVIDDILELSRIKDGKVRLDRVRTDLVALVRRLVDSWHTRASQKRIEFDLQLSGGNIVLEADPLLLQTLLDHLLNNAFKFTPENGRVSLAVEECGTAVRLTVQDNGIGIPEEQLDAIFEQFYQVDASATRQHNGQGVGLALCHDIVGYHDGRIWAENADPHGAVFTALLPRRPAVLQPPGVVRPLPTLHDPSQFLPRLMHWVSESLGVRIATLMTPDADRRFLTIRAAIGLPETVVQGTRVRRGAGFAGKVWVTGRSLLVEDVRTDTRFQTEESDARYSTPSLLCVPVMQDLEVIGVLTVNNRIDGRHLSDDDRRLLEAMAPRVAYLLRKFHENEAASHEFAVIQEALRATTTLGHLHHEHVKAVCHEACLAAARAVQLPDEELEHLAFALQFYDVGMSTIPAHLLHKVEPLVDPEQREVTKHVPASLTILAPLQPPAKVRQIIHHHHENYDGSGYPDGIAGEAIPLGARLLRLTDSLIALLQRRSYRGPHTVDAALEEIRAGAGGVYCERLTPVFLVEVEARRKRLEKLTEHNRDASDLARPPLQLPRSPVAS